MPVATGWKSGQNLGPDFGLSRKSIAGKEEKGKFLLQIRDLLYKQVATWAKDRPMGPDGALRPRDRGPAPFLLYQKKKKFCSFLDKLAYSPNFLVFLFLLLFL